MTIEQKIEDIIAPPPIVDGTAITFTWRSHPLVETWRWFGDPKMYHPNVNRDFFPFSTAISDEIIELIGESDLSECLTSKSQYIRECKKYLVEGK